MSKTRQTSVERIVSCILCQLDEFTTDQVAQQVRCPQGKRNRALQDVLATLQAVGVISKVGRSSWTPAVATPGWRRLVIGTVCRTSGLTPPATDPKGKDKYLAAKRTVERLLPVRGRGLLLDSGSQIAFCARALTDGAADPDPKKAERFAGAEVLTNNCLAFLELLPLRKENKLGELVLIGGTYLGPLAASIPRAVEAAWETASHTVAPTVLMSVSAITSQGFYSHYGYQAPWKRLLISRADSVYVVADASKLIADAGLQEPSGQLFLGEEHEAAVWKQMWLKEHLHVVVGKGHESPLTNGEEHVVGWLRDRLGTRFELARQ